MSDLFDPCRAAAPDRDVPGAPGRAGVRPKQSRPKAESQEAGGGGKARRRSEEVSGA